MANPTPADIAVGSPAGSELEHREETGRATTHAANPADDIAAMEERVVNRLITILRERPLGRDRSATTTTREANSGGVPHYSLRSPSVTLLTTKSRKNGRRDT